MFEIMFTFVLVLNYLLSFIYRRFSILVGFMVIYFAFFIDVNKPYVLALFLVLTVIRLKKEGIREDI